MVHSWRRLGNVASDAHTLPGAMQSWPSLCLIDWLMLVLLVATVFFRLGEGITCHAGNVSINHSNKQNSLPDTHCQTARDEVCVHTIFHDRTATAPPYLKFVAGCAPPPKVTADCKHCHRESIFDGRSHNETNAVLYEFSCCCREDDCSTLAYSTALGTSLNETDKQFFYKLSFTPPLAVPSNQPIGLRIGLFVVYTAFAIGIQVLAILYARRVKRRKAVIEDEKKAEKTNRSMCDTAI
ncbi:hypothetical protein PRIPAC_81241 [Pristionchus pacificus]|uniref:Uncharacterized protein n=1 Tax=Pristionchus pacificus TaxID=54126 RepID=A0A2A6CC84_PRIPA|nr:hypothetical protein PRIPAC_81241 [Pristionchus pacificus]|eukprot:PDM75653.1 hypothetical protein PRIPAC_42830 [Pristionchus pacificus]